MSPQSTSTDLYQQGLHWLREIAGPSAEFQPDQWEAIETLVVQRSRLLVVQRTGWGKSMVYFLATKLLRNMGSGPTILISPLLALMRNQLDAAAKLGIRAVSINSTNADDWETIEADLLAGRVDFLLISPERLGNDRFRATVWNRIRRSIGMVAVDEAHCISDWGHDFRPDYRRIIHLLDELPTGTPILGTTATANDRVVRDVAEILGENIRILRGPLTRDSLLLYVVEPILSQAERLVLLAKLLGRIDGSGIIYCTTTYDCQRVAEWLQTRGFNVKAYYSHVEEDTGENRAELEQQLLHNEVKALVASVALGMGFDKPDLHFVIHYQHPGSIIGYYQQIGRAGRGIDEARIVLMHGSDDEEIQQYFIDTAFPRQQDVEKVLRVLETHEEVTIATLQHDVNLKASALDKVLLHLELDGIVARDRRTYQLLKRGLPDFDRWANVSAQRVAELEQLKAYIHHKGCLMRFIAEALDDPTQVEPCGRCQNCQDVQIKSNPTATELDQVRQFLTRQRFITFQPRKMYPAGGVDGQYRGKMKEINAVGLALCYYVDGAHGDAVRDGKYTHGSFSAELVEASAELLERYWATLDERPAWVTCVPSLRHPDLVPTFSQQLADKLGLSFIPAIAKRVERPPQKAMQNSHMQFRNLMGALELCTHVPQDQPVLVVDDIMDSGWTFTFVGNLLRDGGSGTVYPFALARASTSS